MERALARPEDHWPCWPVPSWHLAQDLAAGGVRTCLARPVTVCQPSPALSPCIPAFPHSFLFFCGHCPVSVSSLSLPSDITAVCALFSKELSYSDNSLSERETFFFCFSLFPLFLILPFLLSFISPLLLFPGSPDLSTLLLLKPTVFYLPMGKLFSPVLCSLTAPELCYFLWCLISLETPLASTGVAQDSPAPCV